MKRILLKISLVSVFVEKSHGQVPSRQEMITVNAERKSDRQTFQTWEDVRKKTVSKFNLAIGTQYAKRNKMKKIFLSRDYSQSHESIILFYFLEGRMMPCRMTESGAFLFMCI